jgi:hypothetical protein
MSTPGQSAFTLCRERLFTILRKYPIKKAVESLETPQIQSMLQILTVKEIIPPLPTSFDGLVQIAGSWSLIGIYNSLKEKGLFAMFAEYNIATLLEKVEDSKMDELILLYIVPEKITTYQEMIMALNKMTKVPVNMILEEPDLYQIFTLYAEWLNELNRLMTMTPN